MMNNLNCVKEKDTLSNGLGKAGYLLNELAAPTAPPEVAGNYCYITEIDVSAKAHRLDTFGVDFFKLHNGATSSSRVIL